MDQLSNSIYPFISNVKFSKGFTFLEVMAVLSVLAIIAAYSMSSFVNKIAYHQTKESALIMLTTIKLCRSQSITSLESISCEIDVEDGVLETLVRIDSNQDNIFDTTLTSRKFRGIQYVDFKNTFPIEIVFTDLGLTDKPLEMKICNKQKNSNPLDPSNFKLNLNVSGIVTIKGIDDVECH